MNRNHNATPFIALIALLLMSLACNGGTGPTLIATSMPPVDSEMQLQTQPVQAQPTPIPTPTQQIYFKAGDVISIGNHILIVLGWENIPASAFLAPDAGKKFIAVELLLLNKSQSATIMSSLLQISMKDSTDQKYDIDPVFSATIGGDSIGGELAAGEKIRIKVGFQIPENAQGLQLVFDTSSIFDASVFNAGKVFVDLGVEPIKFAPPAELAGETAQKTYNVGDVVAIGGTAIIINGVSYPAGDQFFQPRAGFKFLVVDLTIENQSSSAITISTIAQASVKDASSQKFPMDFMASTVTGGTPPDGGIVPGEKLRGQVGFQVPTDATGLVFVFDPDMLNTGKVFIALP